LSAGANVVDVLARRARIAIDAALEYSNNSASGLRCAHRLSLLQ
jgi:hypothetical protein